MNWKRPVFALFTALLFFGIAEFVLWVGGVESLLARRDPFQGFSGTLGVFELDEGGELYRTPIRAVTHSFNYQQFAATKPRDGFRVFVLGGSSAQGFPWGGQLAFTHLLGAALQDAWPDRTVEAVNAAAMSYGSHRLRILATELAGYDPDLFVVYGGHNEFVERRFYERILDRPAQLDALRAILYRSRVFSLMNDLLERTPEAVDAADPQVASTGELLGLDVQREYSVDVAAAEREEVSRNFEENLRAIVQLAREAGAQVVLCTVPSNIREWVPNQSRFDDALGFDDRQVVLGLLKDAAAALDSGDVDAALASSERAVGIAPGHAEAHFVLGRSLDAAGRPAEARAAFTRARDLDAQPARASSDLNEILREVALDEGVVLLDLDSVFADASPDGLVGFNLLEDYVHPKPEGHRLIARELWRVILEQGLAGEARDAGSAEFDLALERRGLARDQTANESNPSWLFNIAVVLEKQGLDDQAIQKYRACLALDPNYFVAHFNLGRLLFRHGRYPMAASHYRMALDVQPDYVRAMVGLGESLRRIDRATEAEQILQHAVTVDPSSPDARGSLGGVLSQLGRYPEAEESFRRAIELDPRDSGAYSDLGFTLLFQGKISDAETAFRAGLELKPDDLNARNGLAAVLTEKGELDDAELLFRQNLKADPDNEFAKGGLDTIENRRGRSGD
jgi:tetratricopeptide (TPR) repeat protein